MILATQLEQPPQNVSITISVEKTTASFLRVCFPSSLDTLKVHSEDVAAQLFNLAKRYVSWQLCGHMTLERRIWRAFEK